MPPFFAQQYQLPTRITAHLQMASLAFDVFMADMLRALTTGARLVLCPRETLLDAPALYALMRQEGVDSAEFVPAVLKTLVEYVLASGQSLDFMHVLAAGADSWPVADYEQVRQVVGAQTRLLNVYGLTEATIDNAHWAGDEVPVTLTGVMPIGRPIANTQLYIVDRWLQPVPLGVQGELVIGGQGVGRGYSGQAGLTAERFLPDPFSDMPGARLYRSGDAVRYRPDGTIEFLGRIDQQIKIRGFRIEPGEIEAQLQKHVRVQSAVVLPRREGLSSVHLVAYIVLYPSSGDEPFDAVTLVENIRTFLRARLPDYMIPTSFVFLDALPLTPNKKIDRNALEGTDSRPIEVKRAYEPPRTETEQAVAAIWTKLTGVEQVGLHDNFFELGGHSLLLSRLVAQIRDTFQIHLPMRDVFIDATVANVVAVIERAQSKARQFAATDEERLTQLVDGLSEEQVDAMLDGLLPQKLQW